MNFIWKDLGMIIVVQIIWIYLKLKITPIFNLIWMKLSFSNIWINLIWFDFKFCITKNLFEKKIWFCLPFYTFDLIWFSFKKSIRIGLYAGGQVYLSTAEIVNFTSHTTTTLPDRMRVQRSRHGCGIIKINDAARAVVVAGGCCGSAGYLTSVERLVMPGDDYTAWYWETLPSLPQYPVAQAREAPTLSPTLDNTGVRIIGGCCGDISDVLELAPADGSSSWTTVENVSYNGTSHTVAPILAC